uniref:Uncharacterized protein n=1 Tax=Arundo donax TaxID=35708 RepID=A0A0A9BPT7_ARUDO
MPRCAPPITWPLSGKA